MTRSEDLRLPAAERPPTQSPSPAPDCASEFSSRDLLALKRSSLGSHAGVLHYRPKEARSGRALDRAVGDERYIMMFGFAALSERSFASTTLKAQTQVGYGT